MATVVAGKHRLTARSVDALVLQRPAHLPAASTPGDGSTDRLAALLGVASAMSSAVTTTLLAERCCEGACAVLGARFAVVGLFNPADGTPIHVGTAGLPAPHPGVVPQARDAAPLLATIAREARAIRLDCAGGDPSAIGLPSLHRPLRAFLGVPVASPRAVYGWLYFGDRLAGGSFTEEEARIAVVLAGQLALAFEGHHLVRCLEDLGANLRRETHDRARVEEQLGLARDRLAALAHQLLMAHENERRTIARELHDEIGQLVVGLKLNLGQVLPAVRDPHGLETLHECIRMSERTIAITRDISMALRPAVLDDLGLVPALRWCLDQQAKRSGFAVTFRATIDGPDVVGDAAITCFRIAQGALTNVARHGAATMVDVTLRVRSQVLSLIITDDGVGFQVGTAFARASRGGSSGLLIMQERASLLGGEVVVESFPGRGTTVKLRLPLAGTAARVDGPAACTSP
jgi:signal transduction histidine kinase